MLYSEERNIADSYFSIFSGSLILISVLLKLLTSSN